jgi:hypothetical protein
LEYYGEKTVKEIDAEQFPFEVTRDILNQVQTTKVSRSKKALSNLGV